MTRPGNRLCGLQEAALVTLTPDAREVLEAARFNSEARFKDDLRMLRIEVGFTLPAERKIIWVYGATNENRPGNWAYVEFIYH